jgi:hypothetical protein
MSPHNRPPLRLPTLGAVAEWLRSGLQSRVHRFDSGRRLWSTGKAQSRGILLLAYRPQRLGKATALEGAERL